LQGPREPNSGERGGGGVPGNRPYSEPLLTSNEIWVTAVHDLVRKKNRISKQFVLRKIKRYRSVIQSENYKTW